MTDIYIELRNKARKIELELYSLQSQLVDIRRKLGGRKLEDHVLYAVKGERQLSYFFGDKDTLILIHNMGRTCPHCTAYADGLNGIFEHLHSRGEVLLVSPDDPLVQRELADARGWRFQLASVKGSELSKDLGFEPEPNEYFPGICILQKELDGSIKLVCKDDFEPGDRYSPIWHIFALIDGNYKDCCE
jgi:predicted dithiol-disulfide oxidoreductase (DUF899 family)